MTSTGEQLSALYDNRFNDRELGDKRALWSVLCTHVFQQYVPSGGVVLDLGAGSCEFSNAIRSRRRIAVDLNPDTKHHAGDGVEVVTADSRDLPIEACTVDTVFSSNFFEHLPTKDALLDTLREARRVTVAGGRLVVLMPNIRYLAGRYWDYLDHHLPLTHLSLVEALELCGYEVERVVPRFLPYTVKDAALPVQPWMVRSYLRVPVAWRVLGRQMLVVAQAGGAPR